MKKMLFLFQAEKLTKVLVLSVAFFFVGLASINAQYMSVDDATLELKSEIEALENAIPNATSNAAAEDIAFKLRYYGDVMRDINNGNEVGAAIHDNAPTSKPRVTSSGLVEFVNDYPGFRDEVKAVVNHLDGLLSE